MTPQNVLRQSRAPLYLQVAEILRQRIARGTWREGDLLPTLSDLANEFSVAKITVRQAVKLLEQEGLLAPRRGRGTTVLPQAPAQRPLKVETRLADLLEVYSGDTPDLVGLEDRRAELPGSPEIGTPAPEGYHLLRRMHSREGQHYCIIAIYCAVPVFERHAARLREELALPVLLRSPDIDIRKAHQTLVIGKSDDETASLLGLAIGDPVANVRRILCDASGQILYLADVIYRGDYIRLEMDLLA
ncbi:GntR family transcriptional regulator [Nitratireductor indicus]|uniref:GntR family transcriptional regulator n=1 Tax=Nitratireductor indicus C115 TaxID=1231190 RepID=K2NR32_9HYPH|nr:GntR family transcriptional regulator [Nitratireductor indicus]EKF41850.1 GntR family transcriptional regulator [Nitratireductor indicus C115]MDS1136869.1 GntR family transcriptional regulator [Nitratireductor indicus]SFQ66670.1 GntR family transcriptional regulator [Nitratireductor indicus]